MTYRVGLEPEEVVERLSELADVKVYAKGKLPDLGDVVAARRFVAQVDGDEFRVSLGAPRSEPGAVTGFDHGGGMFRRLYVHGRMRRTGAGTEVALDFRHARSPRSLQRWAGFLVMAGMAAAWVMLGAAGTMLERLAMSAVFMGFVLPVVIYDLQKSRALRSQRLELYSLVEGWLGPEALPEGQRTPYRRRLAPAGTDE